MPLIRSLFRHDSLANTICKEMRNLIPRFQQILRRTVQENRQSGAGFIVFGNKVAIVQNKRNRSGGGRATNVTAHAGIYTRDVHRVGSRSARGNTRLSGDSDTDSGTNAIECK